MSGDGGETSGLQKQKLETVECVSNNLGEIARLSNVVNNPQQTKLIHQRLPIRMRRRAMSYNPNRLPKKYQTMHIQQMKKSGVQKDKKTPARNYRRKASNLKQEYARRQIKFKWLETHIWHAKRFHMKPMWDKFHIPFKSCDKQYRASHRAITSHCFIQDISYMAAIEIVGPLRYLIKVLRPVLRPPQQGYEVSITAASYTNGGREGYTEFYHQNSCPLNCIGRVGFFWKPPSDKSGIRTLWLYTHPSFHEELLRHFIILFGLTNAIDVESDDMQDEDVEDIITDTEERDKDESFKILNKGLKLRNAVYVNKEAGVTITDLKHTLNRFRLTGPLSHATLQKVFKCVNVLEKPEPGSWFSKWYDAEPDNRLAHIAQQSYWNKLSTLSSPGNLSPNMILALTVEDPRLNKASKRMKAIPEAVPMDIPNDSRDYLNIPKLVTVSGFWEKEIRDEINTALVTTHTINKIHEEEGLVPGERCKSEDLVQPIPILLIQRPGNRNDEFEPLGYAAGWDIIIPEGYGLAIWTCLINWGAKAGGLQATQMWDRELATNLYAPDAVAASKDDDSYYEDQLKIFFAKPLNKRRNYFVLGVKSPFRSVWATLVEDWFLSEGPSSKKKNPFFVMRDPYALEKFKDAALRKRFIPPLNMPQNALIPVYLIFEVGGPFTRNSMICLPSRVDYDNYRARKQGSGLPQILEPKHFDKYKKERQETRKKHSVLLRQLKSRRVRERKRLEANLETKPEAAKPDETSDDEYKEKMKGLWLPAYTKTNNVHIQASRKIIGFITKSFFSLSMGKTIAFGYVPTSALITLLSWNPKGPLIVLARDINSRSYFYATLRVMSVN